jgi:hypothetical protein
MTLQNSPAKLPIDYTLYLMAARESTRPPPIVRQAPKRHRDNLPVTTWAFLKHPPTSSSRLYSRPYRGDIATGLHRQSLREVASGSMRLAVVAYLHKARILAGAYTYVDNTTNALLLV